mmetsp:Transcript_96593/g.133959  ORF Transcript_96593/g.133959 Transcript_96593/m.133959 type:complete len:405 (-) Transcript_96593:161-1375(-)
MANLYLKVFFVQDEYKEIRRLQVDTSTTWDQLDGRLRRLFNTPLTIKYEDCDGDHVTMSSAPEWVECLRQFQEEAGGAGPLRIHATAQPALKPAVVQAEFYAEDADEHTTLKAEQLQDVSSLVQTILERHLPAKWYHKPTTEGIPEFLRSAVTLTPDLDINVPKLADCLDTEALRLFHTQDFAGALAMFKDSDSIVHDSAKPYNAACCHVKLGQPTDAVAQLQRAVEAGFDDWAHLQEDEDLTGLHGTPQWAALLQRVLPAQPPADCGAPAQTTPQGTIEIESIPTPRVDEVEPEEPVSPVSITSSATEEFPEDESDDDDSVDGELIISQVDPQVVANDEPETVPVQPTPRQKQISEEDQNVLTLNAMGFDNPTKCRDALQACNGNVQQALDMLLSQAVMTPRV